MIVRWGWLAVALAWAPAVAAAPPERGAAGPDGDVASGAVSERDEIISGEADERDDAIFGASDGRDDAIFGASDSRDDDIFGASDGRDDDIFGASDSRDGDVMNTSSRRDEDIFGEAPLDRPLTREEEILGGGLLSSTEIDRRLGGAGSRLDIGGLLYLRARYEGRSEEPWEEGPLTSPGLFDLYLDGRPSDALRVFARGRITHRFAAPPARFMGEEAEQTSVALDQLWLKFDVEDRLFVTLGRQPIRWGAGRFWNPTDFLNEQARDPLAVFDERLGVGLLKLHLPLEASGWNLYALANFEGAHAVGDLGGAFRAEKLIGATEVSVSTALRREQPLRLGADITFPLWLFDLRGEVALLHGDDRPFFRRVPDFGPGPASLPERLAAARPDSREDEWIPQAVAGAEIAIPYGDDDHLLLGGEYFYNGAGTDDPRLYPLVFLSGQYRPLYLGTHYVGLYATAMGPGSWNDTTVIASLLGNLSDSSWTSRLDWRVRLLTYLDLNTWAGANFGGPGEFRLKLKVPAIPGAADLSEAEWAAIGIDPSFRALLAEGGTLRAAAFEVGAGVSLRF